MRFQSAGIVSGGGVYGGLPRSAVDQSHFLCEAGGTGSQLRDCVGAFCYD